MNDPRLRENFVERIFAYGRLRALFGRRWTVGDIVAFHTAHKLQLMAHSPRLYAELGRLVTGAKALAPPALRASYEVKFMGALEVLATAKRHVNVLQHIFGYVSDRLDGTERRELIEVIDDYGRGILSLVVPLTLVRHYVRRFGLDYLSLVGLYAVTRSAAHDGRSHP